MGDEINRQEIISTAERFGAKSIIIDGKDKFANDAISYAIKSHAKYFGIYPISSSFSRPIIVELAVKIAAQMGCDAIIHTANQSQNSLRRLNGAIKQLGYKGFFGTTYEFSAITREEKIYELSQNGLESFISRNISGDANLWCREFESGALENPENFKIPEHLYVWSKISKSIYETEVCTITFKHGLPTAINHVKLDLVTLISKLNYLVGSYGIGRFSGLEHLDQGEKVLEIREAPAAAILFGACRHLETAILDAETIREKIHLEQIVVREAIEGRWFDTLSQGACKFIDAISSKISGIVEMKLKYGSFELCRIVADQPKYLKDRDNWEKRVSHIRGSTNIAELSEKTNNLSVFKIQSFNAHKYMTSNIMMYPQFSDISKKMWDEFSNSWNDLCIDHYMGDNGKYRYRRYSELLFDCNDNQIINMPHVPYHQSKDVNYLNGDVDRYYDPILDDIKHGYIMNKINTMFAQIISSVDNSADKFLIQIFQNRIIACSNEIGKPTPEGIHQDGVDYVLTLLVNKVNVNGGVSSVHDIEDKSVIINKNLNKSGDFIFLKDDSVLHSVTPISAANVKNGYRDMLIVMFTKKPRVEL